MSMDDVTYATVLAATAISIGIAAASALGDKTWYSWPVAQECPRAAASSQEARQDSSNADSKKIRWFANS